MTTRLPLLTALAATALVSAASAQDVPPADARSEAIVASAESFLATLDDGQRAAVLFDWTDDAQRANWSNFPLGLYDRAGVAWGDLDDAQQQALLGLLGEVLSADGLDTVQQQMAADQYLAEQGGPPDLIFGSDYYYVSFVGTPSGTAPWMLQFGGHHLAVNATVVGPDVTLAPSLTGGQPMTFEWNGETIEIVADEVDAAAAFLAGLSDDQRAKAVVSNRRTNLALGPGEDGKTLAPEGLSGADMTEDQLAALRSLIAERIGLLNEDDSAAWMTRIDEGLSDTWFAWFGPTDSAAEAYWRIVGPRVIMEYAPQDMGGDVAQHIHSMLRDPENDYGEQWAASD